MTYERVFLGQREAPRAADPLFQHLVDTYASETNKVAAVWSCFTPDDMPWRPRAKSASAGEIMKHQLLSERRFFETIGIAEPPPEQILPHAATPEAFIAKLLELAAARLPWIATAGAETWMQRVKFFDVERERIWIFWRRVLHTAHHRTQLTVYLRLLDRPVPAVYGPTADATWSGADPTTTVEAARRR